MANNTDYLVAAGCAGINFWKSSNYNVVRSNKIWYNCTGIKQQGCHDNALINNSIRSNVCLGTGIHVYGSNSIISGNSITGDNGSAIHCEDGSSPKICNNSITDNRGHGIITETCSFPVIYQNNIMANDGFELRNADSSASIYAQNNWWGDAAGPDAGDLVSGLVDFSNWLDQPLDLAVSISKDTAFASQGSRDSVFCSFRKWTQPLNDMVHVQVTAEDPSWLTGAGDFNIALNDSMGADTVICFSVPEYAADGTTNKFLINTTSQSNGTVKKDSFVVIAYASYLTNIEVSPDSLTIKPGQKMKFRANGLDQKHTVFPFTPVWSATSGNIDSTGMFTADSLEEAVFITATDTVSHKFDKAMVQVSAEKSTLARISVSPDSVILNPGGTKRFEAHGYDQFGMPINFSAQWSATGGTIDTSGNFKAGDETGTFTVTATDTSANLSGQAVVIIEFVSSVEESAIIPNNYCLHQNYPNPFNPETTIRFDVKERTPVVLKVYDLLGREVKVLVNSVHQPGSYRIIFDARDFATGVYFYRIQMKNFVAVKKMVLLE
ncbi:right-handed parallel beta-helix repeat-containing protein [candidate division KSB1 bacterium]|nr:right-handed parallel beta-helix repeat-containing protein [candidate division KSB1 bacterium]MBL7094395.1 right-handed parallel beta-helix repeat-containing protein [candidate division KSB1 bacterium]